MMAVPKALLLACFIILCGSLVSADCATSVVQLPTSCTGGEMPTEPAPSGGCRTLRCVALEDSMQVLACDKTEGNVSFFEMYKQAQNGSTVFEICLGETCLSDGGYARGPDFPICTIEPPVNATPINETPFIIGVEDTAPTSDVLLAIDIAVGILNETSPDPVPIPVGTFLLFTDITSLDGQVTIAVWDRDVIVIDGGADGEFDPFIAYVSAILDDLNVSYGVVPSSDVPDSDLRAYFGIVIEEPPVCVPNSPEGEAFQIRTNADQVEIREHLSDVVDTITEDDLMQLKSGRITTAMGTTSYAQYLRLQDNSYIGNSTVNFVPNNDGELADYLVIDTAQPLFIWEIQFDEGLESSVEEFGALSDLEDRVFNIMGTDYTILAASIGSAGEDFALWLMGGAIEDTLREGETREYAIDGLLYEVTLVFVSDPAEGAVPSVKFSINGELTDLLEEGDLATLPSGIRIGVRDILVNSREGVASFYLGADTIIFTDPTPLVGDTFDGYASRNGEDLAGDVSVAGSFLDASNTSFEITSIKYRARLESDHEFLYVPSGAGVRELVANPNVLLSDRLDFRYEGLTEPTESVALTAAYDGSTYLLGFTNLDNDTMILPLLSNTAGSWKYGYVGDLIFVEGTGSSDYVIGPYDYFLVSDARDANHADLSTTNLLRYVGYDAGARVVTFEDQGFVFLEDGSQDGFAIIQVAVDESGAGNLAMSGYVYALRVSDVNAESPLLAVDLNADGDMANDVVTITTFGGAVLDLAAAVQIAPGNAPTSGNGAALTAYVRDGATLETGASPADQQVNLTLRVLAKKFDTMGDERITWSVGELDPDQVTLAFASYSGPLARSTGGVLGAFQLYPYTEELLVGMTDWGTLIEQYDPVGAPSELYLFIPERQRFAQVFVTFGPFSTTCGNISVCGNGALETGEQCDDGNLLDGDHCSSTCVVEAFCGNGAVDAGETCSTCPGDAGACPVARRGGGGGGGGYIPPRVNTTTTLNETADEEPEEPESDSDSNGGNSESVTTLSGDEQTDVSSEDTSSQDEQVADTTTQESNFLTGAVVGGNGGWLAFTLVSGLLAGVFGFLSWRRARS